MNVEAKLRRLSLSNVLEHNQTLETSVLYEFSNSSTNRSAGFVSSCGSHLI